MCLSAEVGRGGANRRDDVRTVQLLLNLNTPQIAGPTVPDGVCGGDTILAIEQFQRNVIGCKDKPGLLTPQPPPARISSGGSSAQGTTLTALQTGLPHGLSQEKLEAIYIHASALVVARFFPPLLAGLALAEAGTPLRQAHFLAQVGHESAELRYTEELASGAAYEGRKDLGNTQKGDGPRFKGRGLIQITGRANYAAYGKARHGDFLSGDTPMRLAKEPALAADVAVWFWQTQRLNALADEDDLPALTRRVNGGENGLAAREALLSRARWFLQTPFADPASAGLLRDLRAVGEEVLW